MSWERLPDLLRRAQALPEWHKGYLDGHVREGSQAQPAIK